MGQFLLDQYSLLHFATGIVAYFLGLSLPLWILLHVTFECVENTGVGIKFINHYLTFWPGGKPRADAPINSIGDTLSAIVGWIAASGMDKLGTRRGWY